MIHSDQSISQEFLYFAKFIVWLYQYVLVTLLLGLLEFPPDNFFCHSLIDLLKKNTNKCYVDTHLSAELIVRHEVSGHRVKCVFQFICN